MIGMALIHFKQANFSVMYSQRLGFLFIEDIFRFQQKLWFYHNKNKSRDLKAAGSVLHEYMPLQVIKNIIDTNL